jgi:hypothetical protein
MANTALKIHNLSTLYPQLALLPPLKRLQSPLLCSLCAIGDAKTQGKTRSFNADPEKLERRCGQGARRSSVRKTGLVRNFLPPQLHLIVGVREVAQIQPAPPTSVALHR